MTSKKRGLSLEFLGAWARLSDGPEVAHADVGLLVIKFDNDDWLTDGVLTLWHYLLDSSVASGWDHDSVLTKQVVFIGGSNHISSSDHVSNFVFGARGEVPGFVLVERGYFDSSGDEDALLLNGDCLEGSLNSVEDIFEDT